MKNPSGFDIIERIRIFSILGKVLDRLSIRISWIRSSRDSAFCSWNKLSASVSLSTIRLAIFGLSVWWFCGGVTSTPADRLLFGQSSALPEIRFSMLQNTDKNTQTQAFMLYQSMGSLSLA